MNDLVGTLHAFGRLFDRLGIPYAIMGGWAVRIYALPRPTYDVDFTIILDRDRLPELYAAAEQARSASRRNSTRCWPPASDAAAPATLSA